MFLASHQFLTARRRPVFLAQCALAVALLLVASSVFAQGLKYRVRIDAPGPLDELLQNNLDLVRWRGDPHVDLRMLQRLVREAPQQVKNLLETEGYYTPRVNATLDTQAAEPMARIEVDPGPQVVVGAADIELRGPAVEDKTHPYDIAALRNKWTMPPGAPFRQPEWEAAKRSLLRQVTQARFPLAQLAESRATIDPDKHRVQLLLEIDSGPEVRFDGLRIEGLQRYPQTVITNLNKIRPGETYNEAALQAFQGRLQDTGYFASVEVSVDLASILNLQLGEAQGKAPLPSEPVVLPVTVRVSENKQRNVEVGLGYSTNTGPRTQLTYNDLNVLGKRFKSAIILEQKRQTAHGDFYWPTTPKGYNDSLGMRLERNDLNGEVTRLAAFVGRRAWGTPLLERSLTLEALTEQHIVVGFPATRANSLPLTFNITKRAVDNLVSPTRGWVANGQISFTPVPPLADEAFVRLYSRALYLQPVGTVSTLVLRGEVGALGSRTKDGVPASFLFRAGGDQSVRGYAYQSLGVQEGTAVVGGRYLLTGSAEYQYWFKPPWGAAVFFDFGNAADTVHDLKPEYGYGVGARWRSPVGPINLDLAYGHSAHKVRLHFSLGFTF
jgi:translocation and assembly module TamA